jgi:hypothetical protein
MAKRHVPVRPNLEQLKHQAKDLLRAFRRGDAEAVADFREHQTPRVDVEPVKLADAQFVLARSYGLPNWPRLVTACRMTDAIWRGDVEAVRTMVLKDPRLLEEDARGVEGNWGPPMSYAANLGQDAVVEMLRGLGAEDVEYAFGRACLQGKIGTARKLHSMMGGRRPADHLLSWSAYTLNVEGTELLLEAGARLYDDDGKRLAPIEVVLGTDSRRTEAKHRILELYAEYGYQYSDSPVMALHRGRVDLLAEHLRRESDLLKRTFTYDEIFRSEPGGGSGEVEETHGTPLHGTTLLHICADYDEIEIARWLLERGMDVNERAAVDADGFGGHTALFGTVVSQPNFWMNHYGRILEAPFTKLLLEHGADLNVRVSLRKELHRGYEIPGMYEYRDVTPVSWGERFHFRRLVNAAAVEMIRERGGVE